MADAGTDASGAAQPGGGAASGGAKPAAPDSIGEGLSMEDIAGGAAARAGGGALEGKPSVDTILRIPVVMQVVLGSATMPVANLMKLGRGAVVPLDQRVGEPVDVVVNGRVIARGEVVVVDDDTSRFGVSLTEIVSQASGDLPF